MRALIAISPRAVNNPSLPSPVPPLSGRYKQIALHCIAYSVPTILGLLMVIFLAIPAMMPPEFGLDQGSSLSSLNISTSHVSAQWNIALSVKNPRPGEHVEGGEVTIDVVAKSKRRLHLGPWWVPVFDVYFSCMDVTFTAPTDSKSGGNWIILRGTLSCTPDTFTILWRRATARRRKYGKGGAAVLNSPQQPPPSPASELPSK
ncbi:hypothetical protein NL676_029001 [Syzygium grande]|nr:hypothetical protein NL676_029001 [Syzygium grande]